MVYDILGIQNVLTRDEIRGKYDSLFFELAGNIGGKVTVSLMLGKPHESEVERELKDVNFIKTHHGVSVLLDMINEDGSEVGLVISNIINAKFDHGYPFPHTKRVKFHIECHNNMVDHRFIEDDFNKRDEKYFISMKCDENKRGWDRTTCRIFIHDK